MNSQMFFKMNTNSTSLKLWELSALMKVKSFKLSRGSPSTLEECKWISERHIISKSCWVLYTSINDSLEKSCAERLSRFQ